jgi:hypothetical protein
MLAAWCATSALAQQRDPPLTQPPPAGNPAPPRPAGPGGSTLQMPPSQAGKPLRPSPPAPPGDQRAVMLQGLDKVTTRTRRFPAAVGGTVEFGTLRITAAECLVNVPEAPAEAAAYLTIVDHKTGQKPQQLFAGWMFATSPGLSALDSSVYDVWLVGCATMAQASAPSSSR